MSGGRKRPPRALVVVTGSELVRGDRTDRNGPFLARELVSLGLEPARIVVVGDGEQQLEAALREGLHFDLCVVSGGLGPTHDDRTAETVARVASVALRLDPGLEVEIERVSRGIAARLRRPYADFEAGVRKQASLPAGAVSLGLAGTAPGFVLGSGSAVFVVLPGPPSELRRLWQAALASEPVRAVLASAQRPARRVLRFYGASESAVAQALAEAGGEDGGVEATVCAHQFEIWVELLVGEGAGARVDELAAALRARLGDHLFAEDDRPVEAIILDLCRIRGLTLAAAESCTGGLVAARLTSIPGSSDVFRGGIVAYANDAKVGLLGVPEELLARHGAVSREVCASMAAGAARHLDADVAVADTGIAGPGGGTPEKPVGRVYVGVWADGAPTTIELDLPGDRDAVRGRAATSALHLVRRVLTRNRDEAA